MVEPQAYRWEFERSQFPSRPDVATFSIGVFQWLPKKGGGLKKSKTLRVTGYTADPDSVYEKASEVCEKLNREAIPYESLPPWVQKQYSVPKPSQLVLPRRSKELTGREARLIRQREMKRILIPAGFVQSHASTYVRRVGELVQLINFQTMTWGGSFTVNLGLHYIFTPPLRQKRRIEWKTLDTLDCSLRARIGFCLPQSLDTWFEFGSDPLILAERFSFCAGKSVEILDRYTALLEKPDVFLRKSPSCIGPEPFFISYPCEFYASVQIRAGRYVVAKKMLTSDVPAALKEAYRPRHRKLLNVIAQLQRCPRHDVRKRVLIEWIVD